MSRRTVVLAGLVAGVLLLASATQPWVIASGLGEVSAMDRVEIPGSDIADTVTAMALVGLASAVAVTIARRMARFVIGLLQLGAGAVVTVTLLQVIAAPGEASLGALGEVTGTTELAQHYALGPAVWVGLAGAFLLVLAALALLVFSRRWPDRSSKRYEKSRAPAGSEEDEDDPDEFDLWDGLTAGEDPTSGRR
ncbi:Trp biosynthesis-associated membrane protein [Nesterenkonia xinjiangensis]|uniref:Putative membrane protein (TIGR02234 family) n=1 Tax=Nesterenkonia xinjiangensis TaxID=225327 RepID=A0A7Z0K9Z5_9MICC|nr:Trp biosynthesis-associated membrane protein [Nesterenkonia xinjiangensis]NYJ79281.1 putative membrane protein (TIGR02234 family) [Nesterenkonia xinjiangensis]